MLRVSIAAKRKKKTNILISVANAQEKSRN